MFEALLISPHCWARLKVHQLRSRGGMTWWRLRKPYLGRVHIAGNTTGCKNTHCYSVWCVWHGFQTPRTYKFNMDQSPQKPKIRSCAACGFPLSHARTLKPSQKRETNNDFGGHHCGSRKCRDKKNVMHPTHPQTRNLTLLHGLPSSNEGISQIEFIQPLGKMSQLGNVLNSLVKVISHNWLSTWKLVAFPWRCPAKVTAGQQIQTQTPDGQMTVVQVPPGLDGDLHSTSHFPRSFW